MENVKKRKMQYPNTLPMRSFRKNPPDPVASGRGGTGRDRAALQHSITPSRQMRIGLTFLILFFFFTSLAHASPFKGPWGQDNSQKISRKQMDHKLNPLRFLVNVYRTYISPIDGKSCPMYPTCSEYSLQSFKKHGFFIGWMMTCDRLLRCGRDELHLSREIIVNREGKCFDPLENNDSWWYNGR